MYKNNNKSHYFFRTFHKFFCVLSSSTVLFALSACQRDNFPVSGDMTPPETEMPLSSEYTPDAVYHNDTSIYETGTSTEESSIETSHEIPSDITSEASTGGSDENLTGFPNETSNEAITEKSMEATDNTASDASEASENTADETAARNLENLERINSTYGINIRYGNSVVWSYNTSGTGITDEELIASRLALLEDCLRQYPPSFFSDLNAYSPITVNLIDTLGGADGYTDGSLNSSIQIALSCDNSDLYFTLAFHHELFHFIEYCIRYNFDNADDILDTDPYTDTALYGTDDYQGTIYSIDTDIYNQYFTSVYGKTNRLEDRAELFSFYMGNTTKECMRRSDTPISLKMKKLAAAIRLCCPSLADYEDGSLPWEEKIAY